MHVIFFFLPSKNNWEFYHGCACCQETTVHPDKGHLQVKQRQATCTFHEDVYFAAVNGHADKNLQEF